MTQQVYEDQGCEITMDGPWRDANIITRYNAAGVARFAFHMPQGMPTIGATPA